jgi:hypothetical protein
MCGATWQQSANNQERKQHVLDLAKWTFFWFAVFITISTLSFAKNDLMKIWPSITDFYEALGIKTDSEKSFVIQNLSNFFVIKNNTLYMGLKGELINLSDEVKVLPSITISLKDDDYVQKDSRYKKIWTHNLSYKKLLPNQRVIFETELQSVPCNNLICNIALDAL